jgi:hypothetical protein
MRHFLYIVFFLTIRFNLFPQWVNDPSLNTPLVINPKDPTNLTVLGDSNGGGFIVWQDIEHQDYSNIYFIHFDNKGHISLRSSGIEVSLSQFSKQNPIATITPDDEVVILWKEIIIKGRQILSIQKVNSKGQRLWKDFGIQIDKVDGEIFDYSLDCSQQGEIFITVISRDTNRTRTNKTLFKLNDAGQILYKEIVYQKTDGIVHDTRTITNDEQTVGVSWLETVNNKSVLKFNLASFSSSENKEHITISNEKENVIDYSVSKIGKDFYFIWTVLAPYKRIYHQLVSSRGIKEWGQGGKIVSNLRGSNYHHKHSIYGNRILVAWVNEYEKDKNIYVDAFNLKGESIWNRTPLSLTNLAGNQFGHQIVSDNKGAFIIAWIDKQKGEDFGNIYAQKIKLDRKILWDSNGVDLGTSPRSQKSYLNLIDDKNGGAIAVFKDKRNNVCEIYGQKIFSNGKYAGQILGLSSEIVGDSVKIFWYAANEPENAEYELLRKNENSSNWNTIATISKIDSRSINYYEYVDIPEGNGYIFYKIVQKIAGKEFQQLDSLSVFYASEFDNVFLFQNSPNPFSDKTDISFYLPAPQRVEIEIFDDKINLVKVLVNNNFTRGKHTVVLTSDDLPSGVYFYRMKAGDFVGVKKMVLIR